MAKITYNNKTALITNPDIADENKVTDNDMNEIKEVVNENDDKFLTNGLNVSNEVDEDYRVNFLKSKNLFPRMGTKTIEGLTATEQSDGSLILNGTTNSNFSYYYCGDDTNYKHFNSLENGGTFTLSCNEATGYYIYVMSGGSVIASLTDGGSTTFTVQAGQTYRIFIRVSIGTTLNNVHIYPMLNEGSEELEYKPYVIPSIYVDNEQIYNQNIMNYSENEMKIGTWLDKDLYRKVVKTTLPDASANGSTATKTIAHNIANAEMVWFKDAFSKNNNETLSFPYFTSAGYRIWGNASTTTIFLYNQATFLNSAETWIVLEYTKTTD